MRFNGSLMWAYAPLMAALLALSPELARSGSNTASLERLSFRGGQSEDIRIDGTTAYHLQSGLITAYDLSDPDEWVVLSRVRLESSSRFLDKFQDVIVVREDRGIEFVDASNPAALESKLFYPTYTFDNVFWAADGIVWGGPYACHADVSDLDNIAITQFPDYVHSVFGARGDYVYLGAFNGDPGGIFRINLETDTLERVGVLPPTGFEVAGRPTVYGAQSERLLSVLGGVEGTALISTDITDPVNPVEEGLWILEDLWCEYKYYRPLDRTGNVLTGIFATQGIFESVPDFQGIRRLDLTDINNPIELSNFSIPGERGREDVSIGASATRIVWTFERLPGALHFGVINVEGTIDEYEAPCYYNVGGGRVDNYDGVLNGIAGQILFHRNWAGYTNVSNPSEPLYVDSPLVLNFEGNVIDHDQTIHAADGNLAIRLTTEEVVEANVFELRGFEVYEVIGSAEPVLRKAHEMTEFPFELRMDSEVVRHRLQDGRFLVHAWDHPLGIVTQTRIYDVRDPEHIKTGVLPANSNYFVEHVADAQVHGDHLFTSNERTTNGGTKGVVLWNIQDASFPTPIRAYYPPAQDGEFVRILGSNHDRVVILRENLAGNEEIDVIDFTRTVDEMKVMTFAHAFSTLPDGHIVCTAFQHPYLFINSRDSFTGPPITALEIVDLSGEEPMLLYYAEQPDRTGPSQMIYRDGLLYEKEGETSALQIHRFYPTAQTKTMLNILLGNASTPPSHVWDMNGDNQINEADLQAHFEEVHSGR